MHKAHMRYVKLLFAAACLWTNCVGICQPTNLLEFIPAMINLKKEHLHDELSKHDIAIARLAAGASEPKESWSYIADLWLAEDEPFTELLWWTKHERTTRVLIVALNR